MTHDEIFARARFSLTDIDTPGESVVDSLVRSLGKLHYAVQNGKRNWTVTYSGGKDSTLLTIIACEVIIHPFHVCTGILSGR